MSTPRLKRTLRLWDLIFCGIILIQPTAPMPIFGIVGQEAKGHIVTTVLLAMCAMMFTAVSYGRMARAYPSAGSAFTYVGREIHPVLGYLTGWSMLLDYVVNPLICTIWCASATHDLLTFAPYGVWVVFYALLFTGMNLRGIQATARTNQILTAAMGAVIVWMLVASVRYIFNLPSLPDGFFWKPFYDPERFSFAAVASGTSVAVLTYIGFDGLSTLSEEVH